MKIGPNTKDGIKRKSPARSVVELFVGRDKVSPADSSPPKVIEHSVGRDGNVDIEDPYWQLFCREHGIDPALAAWSFADRPEMLHAEGPDEHGDEGHRPHRDPCLFGVSSALVTRLILAKSLGFHSEPCVAALDKKLGTLRAQGVATKMGFASGDFRAKVARMEMMIS